MVVISFVLYFLLLFVVVWMLSMVGKAFRLWVRRVVHGEGLEFKNGVGDKWEEVRG